MSRLTGGYVCPEVAQQMQFSRNSLLPPKVFPFSFSVFFSEATYNSLLPFRMRIRVRNEMAGWVVRQLVDVALAGITKKSAAQGLVCIFQIRPNTGCLDKCSWRGSEIGEFWAQGHGHSRSFNTCASLINFNAVFPIVWLMFLAQLKTKGACTLTSKKSSNQHRANEQLSNSIAAHKNSIKHNCQAHAALFD